MSDQPNTIIIFVDADACPVKAEIYRVAERYGVQVMIVANSFIAIPRDAERVERVIVPSGLDVADDWIAERARPGTIVITADIPLASRTVIAGAVTIAPNGRTHTQSTIGNTLATRNLMDGLRSAGQITGGPAPFAPRDRSAFLSALDLAVVRLKRDGFQV
ncbi:YaiI/YqxD family protein [Paraburkholderia aspalathi]|nr:YaiI/YqxD family protein [Paraburkholderia aspalathi]